MLTDKQRKQFEAEGYAIIPNLFTPQEFDPLRQEIAALIEESANALAAKGEISDTHAEEGFETRLTRLMDDRPDLTGTYLRAIEGKGGGGHAGIEMFHILTHPKLLDLMAELLGDEIVASSVYRIRPKVPGLERGAVPWHQDSGYFASHCDSSLIVTCWIPLVDATIENGCLYVLPCAHHSGVYNHKSHGPSGYLIIPDDELPTPPAKAIPLPMRVGSVLLLTNHAPHSSNLNNTDTIRWSLDLRYQSRNAPTNAFQAPEEFNIHAPEGEIACYPPEGDFVVRSKSNPNTVHTYEQYAERRAMYERAAPLPVPGRAWEPYQNR